MIQNKETSICLNVMSLLKSLETPAQESIRIIS